MYRLTWELHRAFKINHCLEGTKKVSEMNSKWWRGVSTDKTIGLPDRSIESKMCTHSKEEDGKKKVSFQRRRPHSDAEVRYLVDVMFALHRGHPHSSKIFDKHLEISCQVSNWRNILKEIDHIWVCRSFTW